MFQDRVLKFGGFFLRRINLGKKILAQSANTSKVVPAMPKKPAT